MHFDLNLIKTRSPGTQVVNKLHSHYYTQEEDQYKKPCVFYAGPLEVFKFHMNI